MNISDRIKELRKDKGLTQKQLAKEIGYSQPTIVYWEKGELRPTSDGVIALADFFDVSADYLLGRKEY